MSVADTAPAVDMAADIAPDIVAAEQAAVRLI